MRKQQAVDGCGKWWLQRAEFSMQITLRLEALNIARVSRNWTSVVEIMKNRFSFIDFVGLKAFEKGEKAKLAESMAALEACKNPHSRINELMITCFDRAIGQQMLIPPQSLCARTGVLTGIGRAHEPLILCYLFSIISSRNGIWWASSPTHTKE